MPGLESVSAHDGIAGESQAIHGRGVKDRPVENAEGVVLDANVPVERMTRHVAMKLRPDRDHAVGELALRHQAVIENIATDRDVAHRAGFEPAVGIARDEDGGAMDDKAVILDQHLARRRAEDAARPAIAETAFADQHAGCVGEILQTVSLGCRLQQGRSEHDLHRLRTSHAE